MPRDGLIEAALREDIGSGDVTSIAVIPEDWRFRGTLRARHDLVVAGLTIAKQVFLQVDPKIVFNARVPDGDRIPAGAALAEIEGPARSVLTGERTALNFLQMLSGIATLTRQYVDRMSGTNCVLLDTRKTVPGLRALSKYAARCGGAANHRMGLYDAILIKDNHVAIAGSISEAVRRVKSNRPAGMKIEIECDTLSQVSEALACGVDRILLDNMTTDQLREAAALARGRAETEASGGVTLDTVAAIAKTGVNFVSIGRITQSAPACDIGLDA